MSNKTEKTTSIMSHTEYFCYILQYKIYEPKTVAKIYYQYNIIFTETIHR